MLKQCLTSYFSFSSSNSSWDIHIVIRSRTILEENLLIFVKTFYKLQIVLPSIIFKMLSTSDVSDSFLPSVTCYNHNVLQWVDERNEMLSISFPAILDLDGAYSCIPPNFVSFFFHFSLFKHEYIPKKIYKDIQFSI